MSHQKNRPQIRITPLAYRHIEKIIAALSASGQAVSKTSVASQAILSIPLPAAQGGETHNPEGRISL